MSGISCTFQNTFLSIITQLIVILKCKIVWRQGDFTAELSDWSSKHYKRLFVYSVFKNTIFRQKIIEC